MPNSNEYMRAYMKKRYRAKMRAAIAFLGGKCVVCGSRRELEIDHKRPSTKLRTVSQLWTYAEKRFWAEVRKCQLLCQKHHLEKSLRERGQKPARGTHGTLSAYRWCGPKKCEPCRAVKRNWMREWKKRKKKADARNSPT